MAEHKVYLQHSGIKIPLNTTLGIMLLDWGLNAPAP
jgi:hypothetical protein